MKKRYIFGAILILFYLVSCEDKEEAQEVKKISKISHCEINIKNIVNSNIDFEYKNIKITKSGQNKISNIENICKEFDENNFKGKFTFEDGKDVEIAKEEIIYNYSVNLYNFDKCLVRGDFIPLEANIKYKVDFPQSEYSYASGYDARGFDREGFDKEGFDRYQKEPKEFDFEDSLSNNLSLNISTNPNELFHSDFATYKVNCVKEYFQNENYKEYNYPENIKEMKLILKNKKYVLEVISASIQD